MEYTELSAYDVPAGVVTLWTPDADATAWAPDPRGISVGHEEHLEAGGSGSWIGSVLRIPRAFDAEALRLALLAWSARHEVLRTTVLPSAGGWQRRTLPADAVDIRGREVGWLSAPHAGRFISDHFETLDPATWPHCVFATVVEPDAVPEAGFVLAFGADHAVMDAYSQLLWFEEIVSLYDRAMDGASLGDPAEVEVGSHVDFSEQDRGLALALDAGSPPVTRWREFLTAGASEDGELRFPRFPVPGIEAAADLPQTSLSMWLADAEQASALTRLCREVGTSAQSGVLAALSVAMKGLHGTERLRYILPMHTRYDAAHLAAVGWYVGICPVDVDISGVTGLPDLVGRVHRVVAEGKDLVRHPYARIGRLLGVEDGPRFAVSYVDCRYVPGADRWEEWQARALRSRAYSRDEVYLWFVRTAEGINVSARYPATYAAERAVRALAERIRYDLARVTAGIDLLAEPALLETTA